MDFLVGPGSTVVEKGSPFPFQQMGCSHSSEPPRAKTESDPSPGTASAAAGGTKLSDSGGPKLDPRRLREAEEEIDEAIKRGDTAKMQRVLSELSQTSDGSGGSNSARRPTDPNAASAAAAAVREQILQRKGATGENFLHAVARTGDSMALTLLLGIDADYGQTVESDDLSQGCGSEPGGAESGRRHKVPNLTPRGGARTTTPPSTAATGVSPTSSAAVPPSSNNRPDNNGDAVVAFSPSGDQPPPPPIQTTAAPAAKSPATGTMTTVASPPPPPPQPAGGGGATVADTIAEANTNGFHHQPAMLPLIVVDARSSAGHTPLHLAIIYRDGDFEGTAASLITAGATLENVNSTGDTMLHSLVKGGGYPSHFDGRKVLLPDYYSEAVMEIARRLMDTRILPSDAASRASTTSSASSSGPGGSKGSTPLSLAQLVASPRPRTPLPEVRNQQGKTPRACLADWMASPAAARLPEKWVKHPNCIPQMLHRLLDRDAVQPFSQEAD